MGNWRRVQVIGTCSVGDADIIRVRLNVGFTSPMWSPLCCGGIVGLRGVAPSLRCVVHCGADYEGDACIATVVCDDDGVRVGPPQVAEIPEQSVAVAQANMARFLVGMR